MSGSDSYTMEDLDALPEEDALHRMREKWSRSAQQQRPYSPLTPQQQMQTQRSWVPPEDAPTPPGL